MSWIPNGSTDRHVAFVAVDATDKTTRETAASLGAGKWDVYYSLDGGTMIEMVGTTDGPTVIEQDATNAPGDFWLLVDDPLMTTLAAGHDVEELSINIYHSGGGMARTTRVVDVIRPKATEGQTIGVSAGAVDSVLSNAELAPFIDTDGVIVSPTSAIQGLIEGLIADVAGWTDTDGVIVSPTSAVHGLVESIIADIATWTDTDGVIVSPTSAIQGLIEGLIADVAGFSDTDGVIVSPTSDVHGLVESIIADIATWTDTDGVITSPTSAIFGLVESIIADIATWTATGGVVLEDNAVRPGKIDESLLVDINNDVLKANIVQVLTSVIAAENQKAGLDAMFFVQVDAGTDGTTPSTTQCTLVPAGSGSIPSQGITAWNKRIHFTDGPLAGEQRLLASLTAGGLATFSAFGSAPEDGNKAVIA